MRAWGVVVLVADVLAVAAMWWATLVTLRAEDPVWWPVWVILGSLVVGLAAPAVVLEVWALVETRRAKQVDTER